MLHTPAKSPATAASHPVKNLKSMCRAAGPHSQILPACACMLGFALLMLLQSATLQAQPPGAKYQAIIEAGGVPAAQYQLRREQLLSQMPDSSVAFFFSADTRNRQNDVDFEYRQSSDLLYLTGAAAPKHILVLIKPAPGTEDEAGATQLLFAPAPDDSDALWHGPKPTLKSLSSALGIETAPLEGFQDFVKRMLEQSATIFISQWPSKHIENPLFQSRTYSENLVRDYLDAKYPQVRLRSLRDELNALREIKDEHEIELLATAVKQTIFGFEETLRGAEAGMWEYQLEGLMEGGFKMAGAHATGYPSIVGSGPNTCILHYIDNRRQTQDGDLVLMDCGAEAFGYTADITRTFPVNGTFTEAQRQIYKLVLEAQDSVFAICRPGTPWSELYQTSGRVIANGLLKLGITTEYDQVRWYFPHGVSHRLGLDVHDVRSSVSLQEGFVLTVEPGVYIPAGSPCDERWWNIGVRIEDDVVITADGYVNLSEGLPRAADAIEALMRQ